MTEEGAFAVASPCMGYHLMLERLASNFAVYPIGSLPHSGNWLVDERILTVVKQLDRGCLYLDCSRMNAVGSESLGNLVRLCRMVRNRDSRVILCNLQPHLEEFVTAEHHNYLLRFFDIHDEGLPGGGSRLPDPSWLAWNDGTALKLAQGIYEEMTLLEQKASRNTDFIGSVIGQAIYKDLLFDRLPILADALEEAGCHDDDILAHCRGPGPHVLGCWVIDWLLGKK